METNSDLKNLLGGGEACQLSHDAMESLTDLAGRIEKKKRMEDHLAEMDEKGELGSDHLDAIRETERRSKYMD